MANKKLEINREYILDEETIDKTLLKEAIMIRIKSGKITKTKKLVQKLWNKTLNK